MNRLSPPSRRSLSFFFFVAALFAIPLSNAFAQAPAVLRFGGPQSVVEESATSATILVFRSTPLGQEARVSFVTRAGTAIPGVNYVETAGELIFAPHVSARGIEVPILDDGIYTDAGSFQIELTAGAGTVTGEPEVHTVKIQDDDGPGEFEFRWQSSSASEYPYFAEIEVIRKKGRVGTVEVFYHTEDGDAVDGQDYVAASGSLVFEPGVMTQKIRVQILDDDVFELYPDFTIHLDEASNGGTLGPLTTHNLLLLESDPEPSFRFANSTSTVREGEKYLAIPVVRRGMADQAWQIGYTVKSGSALGSADFEAVSGVLTFDTSTTQATIFVPLIEDDEVERDETFTVELTNPDGYSWIEGAISRFPHTVTLIDNDTVYAPGAGTYVGNVEFDADYFITQYGTVTLTITENGSFSGVFRYQGSSFRFRGKRQSFGGLQGQIDMRLRGHPGPTITLEVNPDLARVEGKIVASVLPPFKFKADRVKAGSKEAPVAESGRYTAGISGGGGFAMEIGATGRATLLGFASNGRTLTAGGMVDRNGRVCVVLAELPGVTRHRVDLAGSIELLASGPWQVGGKLLPNLGGELEVWGAAYLPPASGRILSDFDLNHGAGRAIFSTRLNLDRDITLSPQNRIAAIFPEGERWNLKFEVGTGLFGGSISFPNAVGYRVRGIGIQQPGERDDLIFGVVRNPRAIGSMSIMPKPALD